MRPIVLSFQDRDRVQRAIRPLDGQAVSMVRYHFRAKPVVKPFVVRARGFEDLVACVYLVGEATRDCRIPGRPTEKLLEVLDGVLDAVDDDVGMQ